MSVDKNKRKYIKKPLEYKVNVDHAIQVLLRVMPHLDTLDDVELNRVITYLCQKYNVSVDINYPLIEYYEDE